MGGRAQPMASHQTASEFGSGLEGAAQTAPERYAADLTAALAFYRDDQYAEAAGQLARCRRVVLAESRPKSILEFRSYIFGEMRKRLLLSRRRNT